MYTELNKFQSVIAKLFGLDKKINECLVRSNTSIDKLNDKIRDIEQLEEENENLKNEYNKLKAKADSLVDIYSEGMFKENLGLTNFSNVCFMNEVFGTTQCGNEEIDWSAVEFSLKIITSEFTELVEAVQNRDYEKLKDGVGDTLVTAYNFGYVLKFDADKLMDNIFASNMSKVCHSLEEAEETVKSYASKGIEVYISPSVVGDKTYYIVKSSKEQLDPRNGQMIPADKTLKSINFKEPDLNVDIKENKGLIQVVGESALDIF